MLETEAFHPGVSSGEVDVEGILLRSLLLALRNFRNG